VLKQAPIKPGLTVNGTCMISVVEFAVRAGVTSYEIWAEVNRGWLKTIIINNHIYISEHELNLYIMRKDSFL
jgi:hypothetical protein